MFSQDEKYFYAEADLAHAEALLNLANEDKGEVTHLREDFPRENSFLAQVGDAVGYPHNDDLLAQASALAGFKLADAFSKNPNIAYRCVGLMHDAMQATAGTLYQDAPNSVKIRKSLRNLSALLDGAFAKFDMDALRGIGSRHFTTVGYWTGLTISLLGLQRPIREHYLQALDDVKNPTLPEATHEAARKAFQMALAPFCLRSNWESPANHTARQTRLRLLKNRPAIGFLLDKPEIDTHLSAAFGSASVAFSQVVNFQAFMQQAPLRAYAREAPAESCLP